MTDPEQRVRSTDGTPIGFVKAGSGPPVVIVHGAFSGADRYLELANRLADRCTAFVMDRRGRGRSGDGDGYAVDREIEDLSAVLEAAGADADLFGHSSGAIYALETVRRQAVDRLVLYEPPFHFRGADAETFVDRMDRRMKEGRADDAVRIFFGEQVGVPDDELERMPSEPIWDRMVQLAPTFIREWKALFDLDPTPGRYQDVDAETLLLVGSESPEHHRHAVENLDQMLPNSHISILEGHGHLAHVTGPGDLAQQVADFVATSAG